MWRVREIWWGLKQAWKRAVRGYDDSWLWGFSDVFPDMFLNTLDFLIKKGNSFPSGFKSRSEYVKMLRKMRRGFKALSQLNGYEVEYGTAKYKKCAREASEALTLFSKYFNSLWD